MESDVWQKSNRTANEILKEYNEGWYEQLLELWKVFSSSLKETGANPGAVLRFYYRVQRHIAEGVEANTAVYRTSQDNYLFSCGDEMLVGDITLGGMFHLDMIVRMLDRHLAGTSIRTVVEPGCGSGINLFHLHAYLDLDRIVGGDICANAVLLGNQISERLQIPGEFYHFDYSAPDSLGQMTRCLQRYALMTCHSIEQIQLSDAVFVDRVLGLPNPPQIVMQFEPLIWEDDSLMSRLCRKYARKNRYNEDLLAVLTDRQSQGRLTIVDCQKRCFGLSAFNPTSFVCWKPLQ